MRTFTGNGSIIDTTSCDRRSNKVLKLIGWMGFHSLYFTNAQWCACSNGCTERSKNAGILAASILGTRDPSIQDKITNMKMEMARQVMVKKLPDLNS